MTTSLGYWYRPIANCTNIYSGKPLEEASTLFILLVNSPSVSFFCCSTRLILILQFIVEGIKNWFVSFCCCREIPYAGKSLLSRTFNAIPWAVSECVFYREIINGNWMFPMLKSQTFLSSMLRRSLTELQGNFPVIVQFW